MLLPTMLVGSYPQPDWLIDRQRLAGRFPPRVRARELWRIPEPNLAEAQDDATLVAIKAQEEAGLDIITDGEIRRESYSNRFATALEGIDLDNPGTALDRSGHPNPGSACDWKYPQASRGRREGSRVPAPPHASARQGNGARTIHDGAAGADRSLRRQSRTRRYGLRGRLERMKFTISSTPARTSCRSMSPTCKRGPRRRARSAWRRSIGPWKTSSAPPPCTFVLDTRPSFMCGLRAIPSCPNWRSAAALKCRSRPRSRALTVPCSSSCPARKLSWVSSTYRTRTSSQPEVVANRIRRALPFVGPENLLIAPDCGMKYLPREMAFGKLQAMVAGRANGACTTGQESRNSEGDLTCSLSCAEFCQFWLPRSESSCLRSPPGRKHAIAVTRGDRGHGAQARRDIPRRADHGERVHGAADSVRGNRESPRLRRHGAEHDHGRDAERRQLLHHHPRHLAGAQQRAFGRRAGRRRARNQSLRVQPGAVRHQADRGAERSAGRALWTQCHRRRDHHPHRGPDRSFRRQHTARHRQRPVGEGPGGQSAGRSTRPGH